MYETWARRTANTQQVKFLVTSRAYHTIQDGFQAIPEHLPSIGVRGEDHNDEIYQEINLVIQHLVAKIGNELKLPIETKERIESTLLDMKHRTYLWLHLTIGEIRKRLRDSLRPDRVSINLLPASVEEAYNQILRRVMPEQEENVKSILAIILGARRALTVAEMFVALGIATETLGINRFSDVVINKDRLERNLQQWCGLFVFINHSRIDLIHQTAKEFLIQSGATRLTTTSSWRHVFTPLQVELIMARVCVNFLLLPDIAEHLKDWPSRPAISERSYCQLMKASRECLEMERQDQDCVETFLRYYATYWPNHLQLSAIESGNLFLETVSMLYDIDDGQRYWLWLPAFWASRRTNTWDLPPESGIHLAAFIGHREVLKLLIHKQNCDLTTRDESGRTALKWAVIGGHPETARVVLDAVAARRSKSRRSGATDMDDTLQESPHRGHNEIAQLLIERGANINAQGCRRGTPLEAALFGASETLIQQLLKQGADPNATTKHGFKPLHEAAARRSWKVARMLVEHGADLNAGTKYGKAPLFLALRNQRHDVVVHLLKLGANPEGLADRRHSPFQSLIWWGSPPESVDYVLKHYYENFAEDLFISVLSAHFADFGTHEQCIASMRHGSSVSEDQLLRRCLENRDSDADFLVKYERLGRVCHPKLMMTRSKYLPKVLLQCVRTLLSGECGYMYFSILGKLLWLLQLPHYAIISFRLDILVAKQPETRRLGHDCTCDLCGVTEIRDVRHVCTRCEDTDLCGKCFRKHQQGEGLSTCAEHPFISVPLLLWDTDFGRDPEKGITEKMRIWLQEIEAEMVKRIENDGAISDIAD